MDKRSTLSRIALGPLSRATAPVAQAPSGDRILAPEPIEVGDARDRDAKPAPEIALADVPAPMPALRASTIGEVPRRELEAEPEKAMQAKALMRAPLAKPEPAPVEDTKLERRVEPAKAPEVKALVHATLAKPAPAEAAKPEKRVERVKAKEAKAFMRAPLIEPELARAEVTKPEKRVEPVKAKETKVLMRAPLAEPEPASAEEAELEKRVEPAKAPEVKALVHATLAKPAPAEAAKPEKRVERVKAKEAKAFMRAPLIEPELARAEVAKPEKRVEHVKATETKGLMRSPLVEPAPAPVEVAKPAKAHKPPLARTPLPPETEHERNTQAGGTRREEARPGSTVATSKAVREREHWNLPAADTAVLGTTVVRKPQAMEERSDKSRREEPRARTPQKTMPAPDSGKAVERKPAASNMPQRREHSPTALRPAPLPASRQAQRPSSPGRPSVTISIGHLEIRGKQTPAIEPHPITLPRAHQIEAGLPFGSHSTWR